MDKIFSLNLIWKRYKLYKNFNLSGNFLHKYLLKPQQSYPEIININRDKSNLKSEII